MNYNLPHKHIHIPKKSIREQTLDNLSGKEFFYLWTAMLDRVPGPSIKFSCTLIMSQRTIEWCVISIWFAKHRLRTWNSHFFYSNYVSMYCFLFLYLTFLYNWFLMWIQLIRFKRIWMSLQFDHLLSLYCLFFVIAINIIIFMSVYIRKHIQINCKEVLRQKGFSSLEVLIFDVTCEIIFVHKWKLLNL